MNQCLNAYTIAFFVSFVSWALVTQEVSWVLWLLREMWHKTQDLDFHVLVYCQFWEDYCVLMYWHYWELMKSWGVMAASHCHSWWRWWPAFVSNAHKVPFILILLVFCSGLVGIGKTFFCPLYTFVVFLSAINSDVTLRQIEIFWLKVQ
jgi:hypothetical protein